MKVYTCTVLQWSLIQHKDYKWLLIQQYPQSCLIWPQPSGLCQLFWHCHVQSKWWYLYSNITILNMQKGVFEVKLTNRDTHLGNEDFELDRKVTRSWQRSHRKEARLLHSFVFLVISIILHFLISTILWNLIITKHYWLQKCVLYLSENGV